METEEGEGNMNWNKVFEKLKKWAAKQLENPVQFIYKLGLGAIVVFVAVVLLDVFIRLLLRYLL